MTVWHDIHESAIADTLHYFFTLRIFFFGARWQTGIDGIRWDYTRYAFSAKELREWMEREGYGFLFGG